MNFKHKYIFLLPGLLVLLGILIFPIIFTVRLSLSSWDSFFPGLDFIGLDNYIRLFTDDARFWEAFFRLSFLSVTTVFLQYVIGFSLALMVWQFIEVPRPQSTFKLQCSIVVVAHSSELASSVSAKKSASNKLPS